MSAQRSIVGRFPRRVSGENLTARLGFTGMDYQRLRRQRHPCSRALYTIPTRSRVEACIPDTSVATTSHPPAATRRATQFDIRKARYQQAHQGAT
eukprot:364316-Chlamydomonas_euryale.AAC.4